LSLYAASDGRLWVGTNEGVACYDGTQVDFYDQNNGLPYDLVTAIAQSRDGTLWFGTEGGGVCCYDGQVFQTIQIPDETGCNVIHAIHQDRQGRMWLATEGGLVQYKPRRVQPQIDITEIIAGRSYYGQAEVQFPTSEGRIGFRFAGRSPLERSSYLVYRYRLRGYDDKWQQTREKRVDFPQLQPGEYVFEVQTVDRDLNYSKTAQVKLLVMEDPRIQALSEALSSASRAGEFIGESQTIRQLKRQLQEVAWTNITVLIMGETGTGKGLAARAIHELGERRNKPFIHVNCGALPEGLVDSELFGHERGAFTGAVARKLGKFELADGGTIFLDEIGDLPLESQTRLLHVLQEHTIERVGGMQTTEIDVRVIAATNRNLFQAVRAGTFRADLYYRLNVFPLEIPPLRERKEDIPLLTRYFVRQFAAHLHRQLPFINEGVINLLINYDWPGNVRELEHTLQRAVILAQEGGILPEHIVLGPAGIIRPQLREERFDILPLEEYERRYLTNVLGHTGGVIHGKKGAAHLLGMKPTTLRSRLDKLGVEYRKAGRRQE
jgi:DNA-binding NtrC family response regulator